MGGKAAMPVGADVLSLPYTRRENKAGVMWVRWDSSGRRVGSIPIALALHNPVPPPEKCVM